MHTPIVACLSFTPTLTSLTILVCPRSRTQFPQVPSALKAMLLSTLVERAVLTSFGVALVMSIIAGSSAGNLSKDFPLQFRLAAYMRTTVLMFLVVPMSFIRRMCVSFPAPLHCRCLPV